MSGNKNENTVSTTSAADSSTPTSNSSTVPNPAISTILEIFAEIITAIEQASSSSTANNNESKTPTDTTLIQNLKKYHTILCFPQEVLFRLFMQTMVIRVEPHLAALRANDPSVWQRIDLMGYEHTVCSNWLALPTEAREGILQYVELLCNVCKKGIAAQPPDETNTPLHIDYADKLFAQMNEMTKDNNFAVLLRSSQGTFGSMMRKLNTTKSVSKRATKLAKKKLKNEKTNHSSQS